MEDLFFSHLTISDQHRIQLTALTEEITSYKVAMDNIRELYDISTDEGPEVLYQILKEDPRHHHPAWEHYLEWLQLARSLEITRQRTFRLIEDILGAVQKRPPFNGDTIPHRLRNLAEERYAQFLARTPWVAPDGLELVLIGGERVEIRYPAPEQYSFTWLKPDGSFWRIDTAPGYSGPGDGPSHLHYEDQAPEPDPITHPAALPEENLRAVLDFGIGIVQRH
ncbi:MAG: hypothetical protein OWV35_08855 [Firmicutes bacterium]|nr:hypothetical protein [Bacillota bacterium]